jgi:catechol 2,3-dioxygenase-like lactoylglutathione lyase family enzyme
MPLRLDHAVIAVRDLDAALRDYRDLGFTVRRGGVHANRATRNALIAFADGTYLELLAVTGEAPLPGVIDFSVLLQQGEGLVGFALRSEDLDADAARLRAEGFVMGEAIPGERRREDGTVIRWRLALLDGGFAPFLIQDVTPREWRVPGDPAVTAHLNRAAGLRGVEIAVPDLTAAQDRYVRLLGITSRFDAANNLTAVGDVMLRDTGQGADCPAGLYAIHLVGEQAGDDRFALERTHGVRFN